MKLGNFDSDVLLTWDGGGVRAPVDLWVSAIMLALPTDVQKVVLDNVVAEVNRRNSENTDENITGSN